MTGGKRKNAGRNIMPEELKKKGYKIYLTDELELDILECGMVILFLKNVPIY